MSEPWISEENMFGELTMDFKDAWTLFLYMRRKKSGKDVSLMLKLRVKEVKEKYGWTDRQLEFIAEQLYERRDEWRLV